MLKFLALGPLITKSVPLEQPLLLGQKRLPAASLCLLLWGCPAPSDLPWHLSFHVSYSHLCHFTVYKVLPCPVLDSHLLAHKETEALPWRNGLPKVHWLLEGRARPGTWVWPPAQPSFLQALGAQHCCLCVQGAF